MNLHLLYFDDPFLGGMSLVAYFILTVLIEWAVLLLFKINKPGILFAYSFIVNMVTLGLGYVALPLVDGIGSGFSSSGLVLRWIFVYAITVLIEGFLLILLNRQKGKGREKIWIASIVMNLASYFILHTIFGSQFLFF